MRARSVPAASSTAHRPGVDLRPFASRSQAPAARQQTGPQYDNVGTSPQQGPASTLPQQLPANPAGSLDDNTVNLFRQMMQAQDEQIRAQAAQVQQLTNLVKDLGVLGVQNASQTATSAAATAEASSSGDTSGPAPMDVDTGIRSRRAENYIPTLPQLNFVQRSEFGVPTKRSSPVGSVCLTTVSQKNLTSQSRAPSQYSRVLWTLARLRGPASFGSCFVRV